MIINTKNEGVLKTLTSFVSYSSFASFYISSGANSINSTSQIQSMSIDFLSVQMINEQIATNWENFKYILKEDLNYTAFPSLVESESELQAISWIEYSNFTGSNSDKLPDM